MNPKHSTEVLENELLSKKINLEMSKLGIVGFFCTGVPDAEYLECGLKPVFKLRDIYRANHFFSSDGKMTEVANHLMNISVNSRIKIEALQEPEVYFGCNYKDRSNNKINRFLSNKGITSQVRIRSNDLCGKGWLMSWTFISDAPMEETKSKIYQHMDRIHNLIGQSHYALLSKSESYFNPFKGPSNLKGKTGKVLELAALGHTSEEISNSLSITTRGVDYHISRARDILQVNNRIQAIVEATKLRVI